MRMKSNVRRRVILDLVESREANTVSGQSNNIAPIYIEKNGVTLTDVQLLNV
jgi:hypothetical protein